MHIWDTNVFFNFIEIKGLEPYVSNLRHNLVPISNISQLNPESDFNLEF